MKKLFFILATSMLSFQITGTTRDEKSSTIKDVKTFCKKKLNRFNPIMSGVKKAIASRPKAPASIANLIETASLVTKALLFLMPGAIAEGLGISVLAVSFIPYATIANPYNIAASIVDKKNENRYTISNITLQASVINTYGD